MDGRLLGRQIAGASAAHRRLMEHLADLPSIDPAATDPTRPSRLPGWTVGHVLTHLARNADSHVRLLEGVDRGEDREQYEGGAEARTAAIDAGAGRRWEELVADVVESARRLEDCWAIPRDWNARVRLTAQMSVAHDLPFRRWREVDVHHVDLGFDGYTAASWPSEYVREELRRMEMRWNARRPMGLTGLPAEALRAAPHHRLAWLLGRASIDGLGPADVF